VINGGGDFASTRRNKPDFCSVRRLPLIYLLVTHALNGNILNLRIATYATMHTSKYEPSGLGSARSRLAPLDRPTTMRQNKLFETACRNRLNTLVNSKTNKQLSK
jgi:hypothetical protein